MYCVILPTSVLDFLQYVTACLVWGSQKLDTVLQMRSHQCQTDGKDHFPGSAGYFLTNVAQGRCCPLLSGNTTSLCSTCSPRPCGFFSQRAAIHTAGPQLVPLHRVFSSQVWDFTCAFFELDEFSHRPVFTLCWVPLNSNPALHHTEWSPCFVPPYNC